MLIEDVVVMVAESAQKKNVEISAHLAPDAHVAYQGDASRIRQILINLLGNAIKFTTVGEVKLSVFSENNESGDTLLRFEVMDTGIGIPVSAQSSILNRLCKLMAPPHVNTVARAGFSNISQLTELMKGDIGVHSEQAEVRRSGLQQALESLQPALRMLGRTAIRLTVSEY